MKQKKPPFYTTVKTMESFGSPKPLHQQHSNLTGLNVEDDSNAYIESNLPDQINTDYHTYLLAKQTNRWLHLTSTLWSLVVIEAKRIVESNALIQFIEVMEWRAKGQINAEEFTTLYNEWMGKSKGSTVNSPQKSTANNRKHIVGIFKMRDILLERKVIESNLDLFIGMIVNEGNLVLINSSISYNPSNVQSNHCNLDVCTSQWLSLAEELFFCLDISGYGILKFDEMFFFSACLIIGLHTWNTEDELETDLSIAFITSLALQLMEDGGGSIHVSNIKEPSFSASMATHSSDALKRNSSKPSRLYSNANRMAVSITMFKHLLIKRAINERSLQCLLKHIKTCIHLLSNLSKTQAIEIYRSCQSLELHDNIGSPRLWQQAVLSSSGYKPLHSEWPAVLLYLLSDAEFLIPGIFRAHENPVDTHQNCFQLTQDPIFEESLVFQNNPASSQSVPHANEELHETAVRICITFKKWGKGNINPGLYVVGGDIPSEFVRDPIYQMVLTSLIKYKTLQHTLCAALFDMVMTEFDKTEGTTQGSSHTNGPFNGIGHRNSELSTVCALIIPNVREMLMELGFRDADETVNKIQSSRNSSHDVESEYLTSSLNPVIEPLSSQGRNVSMTPSGSPSMIIFPPSYQRSFSNNTTTTNGSNSDRRVISDEMIPISQPTGGRDPSRRDLTGRDPVSRNTSIHDPYSGNPSSRIRDPSKGTRDPYSISRDPPSLDPYNYNSSSHNRDSRDPSSRSRDPGDPGVHPLKIPSTQSDKLLTRSLPIVPSDRILTNATERIDPDDTPKPSPVIQLIQANPSMPPPKQQSKVHHPLTTSSAAAATKPPSLVNKLLETKLEDGKLSLMDRVKKLQHQKTTPPPPTQYYPDSPMSPDQNEALEEKQTEVEPQDEAEERDSEASSISAPNSIAELLAQGQSAGRYAQSLREILRKMSKDDSKVQLKSLEQVLKLGQKIVQEQQSSMQPSDRRTHHPPSSSSGMRMDQMDRTGESSISKALGVWGGGPMGQPSSLRSKSSQRQQPPPPPGDRRDGGKGGMTNDPWIERSPDRQSRNQTIPYRKTRSRSNSSQRGFITTSNKYSTMDHHAPPAASVIIHNVSAVDRLRKASVPGLTPDGTPPTGNRIKKVFGHPL